MSPKRIPEDKSKYDLTSQKNDSTDSNTPDKLATNKDRNMLTGETTGTVNAPKDINSNQAIRNITTYINSNQAGRSKSIVLTHTNV